MGSTPTRPTIKIARFRGLFFFLTRKVFVKNVKMPFWVSPISIFVKMMALEAEVAQFCRRWLRPDTPLLVAVSGGPDSLAMLYLLHKLGQHPLTIAHFNHQLRPEAADEAQFVADTGRNLQLPWVVGQADVADLAGREGLSLEEAARQARYQFLGQAARNLGAEVVVTGHNADDQAETVLMHFLRGSGPAGLRGMLPLAPLPGTNDLQLARPLLNTGREAILAYCAANQLRPVFDSSNQDLAFFRNRLRHELLPSLATYNPNLKERLQHSAAVLAADYELLDALSRRAWQAICREQGPGWLRLDLAGWRELPLSLRRSTLRHGVWQLRQSLRDVAFRPVELARQLLETGAVGQTAALPGNISLRLGYDDWWLTAGREPPFAGPQLADEHPCRLPVPGRVALQNGWVITSRLLTTPSLGEIWANKDPWQAYLLAPTDGQLWLRPRRPGELFQPLGLDGHSSRLKAVMINRKIPAGARPLWPIVADQNHLFWLTGHLIDYRVRVVDVSRPVVHLRVMSDE